MVEPQVHNKLTLQVKILKYLVSSKTKYRRKGDYDNLYNYCKILKALTEHYYKEEFNNK